MDHEFTRSPDSALVPQHQKISKARGGGAEQFIHLYSGLRVIGNDVVPCRVAVLLGLGEAIMAQGDPSTNNRTGR